MQIANPPPTGVQTKLPQLGANFLSRTEGELSLLVIALGLIVIVALFFTLRSKQASADDAIRAYTVTLIITGTMVLICAGYSNDQIAPAMGLFGTVAGYLLGRRGSSND
jgi:hypothetical protein